MCLCWRLSCYWRWCRCPLMKIVFSLLTLPLLNSSSLCWGKFDENVFNVFSDDGTLGQMSPELFPRSYSYSYSVKDMRYLEGFKFFYTWRYCFVKLNYDDAVVQSNVFQSHSKIPMIKYCNRLRWKFIEWNFHRIWYLGLGSRSLGYILNWCNAFFRSRTLFLCTGSVLKFN